MIIPRYAAPCNKRALLAGCSCWLAAAGWLAGWLAGRQRGAAGIAGAAAGAPGAAGRVEADVLRTAPPVPAARGSGSDPAR